MARTYAARRGGAQQLQQAGVGRAPAACGCSEGCLHAGAHDRSEGPFAGPRQRARAKCGGAGRRWVAAEGVECGPRVLGAVVALGLLGVLVRVTLSAVPAFRLRKTRTVFPSFAAFSGGLLGPALRQRRGKLAWFLTLGSTEIVAFSRDFLPRCERGQPGGVAAGAGNAWPDAPPVVDWSHRAMTLAPGALAAPQTESEYFLPMRLHALVVRRLRQRFSEQALARRGVGGAALGRLSLIFRYVQGDMLWLSPCYQGDPASSRPAQGAEGGVEGFVAITLVVRGAAPGYTCSPSLFAAASAAFDDALATWGTCRPHWGKRGTERMIAWSRAEKEVRFPKLSSFLRLRQQLDPDGRLLTPFLRSLLSIPPIPQDYCQENQNAKAKL